MNTKAFITLLIAVLALGGGLGGAFVGGMALGKSQGEEVAQTTTQSTSSPGQFPDQFSQEQLDQFRQQFQGQFGSGSGGQGFGGRGGFGGAGGLSGTIEQIEGNTVTLNTSQGPLQVTVGDDTIIQRFAEAASTDLQDGIQITVFGQSGEDGTVEASFILITPEGVGGFFGGGFFGGAGLQNELSSP